VRRLRKGKRKVGRARIEAEQRSDAQIMVDHVNIERRQRKTMGIEQPRAFPCSLPGMFAEVVSHLPRIAPGLGTRLLESDPHGRARRVGQERRSCLTVEIDDQIITGLPELPCEACVA